MDLTGNLCVSGGGGGAITGPLGPTTAPAAAVATVETAGSNYANNANFVKGTTAAMTGTTSTQLVAASGTDRIFMTSLVCGNSHATVGTFVDVQDGSGGSVIGVVPAGAVYGGSAVPLTTPVVSSSSNGIYVADETTGANVKCWGIGYHAP
jgi:hypothetical protein